MASLISCPHCGPRPKEEFQIRSDAALTRPAPDAGAEVWTAYVYLRDNPKGRHQEHWQHTGGCRRWLVVTRDTLSHAVEAVRDVSDREVLS